MPTHVDPYTGRETNGQPDHSNIRGWGADADKKLRPDMKRYRKEAMLLTGVAVLAFTTLRKLSRAA